MTKAFDTNSKTLNINNNALACFQIKVTWKLNKSLEVMQYVI